MIKKLNCTDIKMIDKIKELTQNEKKTIKIIYNDKTEEYQLYILEQKKINL